MKRTQEFSPSSPELSKKKAKVIPNQDTPQHNSPDDPDDQGDWTRVERRKAKKVKKKEAKLDANASRFMYVNGEIVKRREAVGIDDVRDLIIHIIGDAPPPGWVKVENHRSIHKVVALLVPGLLPSFLSLPPLPTSATANPNLPLSIPLPGDSATQIPFIANTFSVACPTRAPGDQTRMYSVLSSFFQGPVSGEEKKKRLMQRVALERALDKDPVRYLLTLEQMIENDYPIPSYMADIFEKPPGWVETPEPSIEAVLALPIEQQMSRIFAIDCEMCLTEDGKELTRVCLLDYNSGIIVYDTLVKPPKPITDYLTRWSGITEASLASVTTTLPEVQAHLLRIIAPQNGPPSILVGHSLESDLGALKLAHPKCIDTAIIYHHPRGRPLKPGLAWLTKKWCNREIQNRGEGGHDAEEDARACVDLLRLKVQNGSGFGEFRTDYESIFERMSRAVGRGGPGSVRSAVVDYGNPSAMHGSKAQTTLACNSDDEVLKGVLGAVGGHEFIFGRFTGVAGVLGWLTPKSTDTMSQAPPPTITEPSPESVSSALSTLNTHLSTLYAALPPRTAFIVFTGHSDPRKMAALGARKSAFDSSMRGRKAEDVEAAIAQGEVERWTSADGRELEGEVERAKRGLLFLGIK